LDEIGFLEIYSFIKPPNAKITIIIEITSKTTTGVKRLSERIWINEVNVSVP
jgi:hypothetical protein